MTDLTLEAVPCTAVRLVPVPCLRRLRLLKCTGLNDGFLQQLGGLASLRKLHLLIENIGNASLAPLSRLSLLETLKLPRDTKPASLQDIRRMLGHLPLLRSLGPENDSESESDSADSESDPYSDFSDPI